MHNYLQPTLQWWKQRLNIATQNQYYHNVTLVVAIGTHYCNHLFHRSISAFLLQQSLWLMQHTILVAISPIYRYQLCCWNGCHRTKYCDQICDVAKTRSASLIRTMKESGQLTTYFITPYGSYCYVTMPFGLKYTGATYQRCMLKCFGKLIGRTIEACWQSSALQINPQAYGYRCSFHLGVF